MQKFAYLSLLNVNYINFYFSPNTEDDTPSGFPMEVLECRNLEFLNLYYQGFVSVPPEIGNLQDLKILNVSLNPNLLSIPAEVGTISCLTSKSSAPWSVLISLPTSWGRGDALMLCFLCQWMCGWMYVTLLTSVIPLLSHLFDCKKST